MGIDQFDYEKEADNLIFTFSVNFCTAFLKVIPSNTGTVVILLIDGLNVVADCKYPRLSLMPRPVLTDARIIVFCCLSRYQACIYSHLELFHQFHHTVLFSSLVENRPREEKSRCPIADAKRFF